MQEDENITVRKVRKTAPRDIKSSDEDNVEFAHLIDKAETDSSDVTTTEEEDQMDDALSFITSDPEEKAKKRRRVRRKKSND